MSALRVVFAGPAGGPAPLSVRWLVENTPAGARSPVGTSDGLIRGRLSKPRLAGVDGDLEVELVAPTAHADPATRRRALEGADAVVLGVFGDGRSVNEDALNVLLGDLGAVRDGPRVRALQLDGDGLGAHQLEAAANRLRALNGDVGAETFAVQGRGLIELLAQVLAALAPADDETAAAPTLEQAISVSAPPAPVEAAAAAPAMPAPARLPPQATRERAPVAPLAGGAAIDHAAPGQRPPRRTVVRWYRRMRLRANHPLDVGFSLDANALARGQSRVVGAALDADTVRVIPVFPGCVCVPGALDVDLTAAAPEARFWVTPMAEGKLAEARVEIWRAGRRLDVVPTPADVRTTAWAKFAALCSILTPLTTFAMKAAGVDVNALMMKAMPFLETVIEGWGPTEPALALASVALLVAVLLWLRTRPKQAAPIEHALPA